MQPAARRVAADATYSLKSAPVRSTCYVPSAESMLCTGIDSLCTRYARTALEGGTGWVRVRVRVRVRVVHVLWARSLKVVHVLWVRSLQVVHVLWARGLKVVHVLWARSLRVVHVL